MPNMSEMPLQEMSNKPEMPMTNQFMDMSNKRTGPDISWEQPELSPMEGTCEQQNMGTQKEPEMQQPLKRVPMICTHSRLWSYLEGVSPAKDTSPYRQDTCPPEQRQSMMAEDLNSNMPQSFTSMSENMARPMEKPAARGDDEVRLSVMGPFAGLWRWRRVTSRESDYSYLMGEVEQDGRIVAVAVAVPGTYSPSPPSNLQGFHAYRDGHWILAQDAATGEIIDI